MIKLVIGLLLAWSLFYNNTPSKINQAYNYSLISDSSLVEWKGASPKVSHHGSFSVTGQGIEVVDGQIKGGTFIIPIESIRNNDLPKAIKPVLLKHLKSKDFFHISLYPEAQFTLTTVTPLDSITDDANVLVKGNFTMLGNTHSLSFPAKINFNNNIMAVEAKFKLDRTKWGMTHAADPALENRHIYPDVDIHLKVYASHISTANGQ